ncbi:MULTISPECIES: M23 family metallopeptidase [unclassified Winogradskyella]|uniref:M23 family metallopeptidase n=1 Tax=unclassified Winogradskyella TaxID=2615021 RepID=UPI0012FC8C93|nr:MULTISPECIES: M23 family metallopeptidase [unclassified Winogradskyella]
MSCSKKITSPSFIDFKVENDSIYVISKNKLHCPLYVKAIHRKTNKEILNQLESKGESVILKYPKNEIDSNKILKRYKFAGYYGRYPYQENDTNQMYTLPFQKGYESLVIQGYDGDFSHHGSFSAKCLDFEMAVGDTIVAAKDGIVVKIVSEHNKQGTTESFKKYGNYVMLYHKNNTFSQYVHIKQYGNLVKVGDSVKAKQPIALSGFTGWSTSPHLHFGVYKPEVNGLESIPIILDSIPAKNIKRGHILTKN